MLDSPVLLKRDLTSFRILFTNSMLSTEYLIWSFNKSLSSTLGSIVFHGEHILSAKSPKINSGFVLCSRTALFFAVFFLAVSFLSPYVFFFQNWAFTPSPLTKVNVKKNAQRIFTTRKLFVFIARLVQLNLWKVNREPKTIFIKDSFKK